MLIYNIPRVPFGINTLVARVRFCDYDCRQRICSSICKYDKKKNCISETFFLNLAFRKDFTAKGYEERSRNCPDYTFRQTFYILCSFIRIQKYILL